MEKNLIHLGDCLAGMSKLPDNSVDFILCDPPYGVLNGPDCKWDKKLPLNEVWAQYKRVLKPGGVVVLFAMQPFATEVINSNRAWFRYEWVWVKSRASNFLNAKRMPLRGHENVLVFCEKATIYNPQKYVAPTGILRRSEAKRVSYSKAYDINGAASKDYFWKDTGERFPDSVLEFASPNEPGMHPTPKPIALFEFLIRTYTNEGALVLDNCMGGGTTALACRLSNRDFIGFEIEQRFVELAYRRLRELPD